MSVFSIPVTIGVDEERIAREIESNVEAQVVNKICDELKDIIYKKRYYDGKPDINNPEPLREMVRREIVKILDGKEQLIIDAAADTLADKLSRTKVVKEKAAAVAEEVLG